MSDWGATHEVADVNGGLDVRLMITFFTVPCANPETSSLR